MRSVESKDVLGNRKEMVFEKIDTLQRFDRNDAPYANIVRIDIVGPASSQGAHYPPIQSAEFGYTENK